MGRQLPLSLSPGEKIVASSATNVGFRATNVVFAGYDFFYCLPIREKFRVNTLRPLLKWSSDTAMFPQVRFRPKM